MTRWKWAAASRCGTAHARSNTCRQDAARVLAAGDFIVAVACYGAGSTSHGGLGAVLAARLLSEHARRWLEADGALPSPAVIDGWVDEVRAAIAVCADRRGCRFNDFATTVVMALSNGTSTLTMHIGDGAILARGRTSAELLELSWPDSGDYAATTFFITDAVPRVRIGVLEGYAISGLALITDGLERLALDFRIGHAHPGFFAALFMPLDDQGIAGRDHALSGQLAAFLDTDAVNARTDDDKTLILAVPE